MAELTTVETETNSCCSTEAQQTCCEPTDKAACCGESAAGGTCGCSARKAPIDDVREKVRERYAAAARTAAPT